MNKWMTKFQCYRGGDGGGNGDDDDDDDGDVC